MHQLNNKLNWFNIFLIVSGGLIILFIIGPLLGMLLHSSPKELFATATENEVKESILRTLVISFVTTIIFGFAAIPFAFLLARRNFIGKKIVTGLIDIPVVIPHSAAGIAVLGVISRNTVLGKTAGIFGLNLVGHPIGIGIAMAFVSLPFLINAARNGFESVPVRLEKAAMNLGASPVKSFFSISLPLASRHIISGFILMFGRGMSEFGAVVIVAYHPMITPVLIYERFTSFGLKYAQPVSVIFIGVCLLFFILLRFISIQKNNHA